MQSKYPEYKQLNLPELASEILSTWESEHTFEKSVRSRDGRPPFVFYEGPPSANGLPGIHHVMARAIKDIFCRYKTLKGYQVNRKGGWDTHGLPIELSVEKTLGIRKDDIGKKISIEDYNAACRREVMKYKDVWDDLTRKMGYWVDLENPYITFTNDYIETCWYLLSKFYKKGLLYKGYTIQPYSPAAGTGLSSHELNQPGTYKMVKDTTAIAMFKIIRDNKSEFLFEGTETDVHFLAWTTTPWTLPSNTALAVGKDITYAEVQTYNQYTHKAQTVVLAKDLLNRYFTEKNSELKLEEYKAGDKEIPFKFIREFKGDKITGIRYEQLLPFAQPEYGDAFRVLAGDFVTTQDGTGIVHIAPSFGSDDFRVAQQNGIGSLTLVDKQGRFISDVTDFAGEYVKEQYLSDEEKEAERVKQGGEKYLTVDERIVIRLKKEGKAFRVEKYEHTYPHCWRTDKPVLYYPLDSWFIRTTAAKERMVELNKSINWKPESTGTGRFGNWLENLVDWNLSRSRYWGIPLPIWRTEDGGEEVCIGSVKELYARVEESVKAGFMKSNPLDSDDVHAFDLHRPFVDDIILVASDGKKMFREPDLIDVWFDSGAMPYAQWHYMGPGIETLRNEFPADFIAEGVDQTRGWFFTLHAIAVMLFDSVAYKNVVSNGLVLDKNGNKMSKRLGNAVDPFETLTTYGPDATRWYMISNAQPWDNLRFNNEGISEVQRKFFGTLYNTYSFFALYANIDGFTYKEEEIPVYERAELDRWILSELNSLVKIADESYADYEPTKASRAISEFVTEHLSNWYVRLSRRRFWKGDYTKDKIAAYQTLYTCLETISILMSPIAPFYSDRLFRDLNSATAKNDAESVHLALIPPVRHELIDKALEERMELAQRITSMVLSLRKKVNIRVRQPLNKIMIPAYSEEFISQMETVRALIMAEVNIKNIEFIQDTAGILVKKIKPNFKILGKKVGPLMKEVAATIGQMGQEEIVAFEKSGQFQIQAGDSNIQLLLEDVEILSEDIPGWQVASEGNLTVALDTSLNDELKDEGLAREFINRIQNLRKDKGYEVTDRIDLKVLETGEIRRSLINNKDYICAEILAASFELVDNLKDDESLDLAVDEDIRTKISIRKHGEKVVN
ncbi:MAG: isoleucine--tRNA ligase [Bacteroidetes bacterium]|nr:MAG: isoleucine--tRNA ligase [Bacteroidota bacterium]REK05786.1 MAG: isoleucine--tRNA ligase [Bacteroidota bacterium]REK31909.1 MAG: isoleucine--tRNA ligase [Bacteroidota bacterium]REK49974.1 MAG: isoleucine--tRNA ligase [Bacteroidota bacterium]